MNLGAPSWLVAWLESVSVWDLILLAAAAAAAVVFIRKKGWRSVKAMAKGILNAAEVLEAVQGLPAFQKAVEETHRRLEEKVDGIHHETHKNDGSSIKDSTVRIEEGVAGLYDEVGEIKRQISDLQDVDAELRADIENTANPEADEPNPETGGEDQ